MNFRQIDGPSRELFEHAAPLNDTVEGLTEAFARLCGAAAWAATLLAEHDSVGEWDQKEWRDWGLVILGVADLHTFGADRTRAEVIHCLRRLAVMMEANDLMAKRERGE